MTATQTAYAWQPYSHRRTPVEAIRYDGTEACRDVIAEKVNRNQPGQAIVRDTEDAETLLIRTQLRWAAVPPGYWVGIGYHGRLWVISDEVFTGCYDPTDGPDHSAVLDRDQAAAIVVAADEIKEATRLWANLQAREYVDSLVEMVHQLAMDSEARR